MLNSINRREAMHISAVSLLGLRTWLLYGGKKTSTALLKTDKRKLIALDSRFHYQLVQRRGDTMSDGMPMPDKPDGMEVFRLDDHRVALMRNHETEETPDSRVLQKYRPYFLIRSTMEL